MLFSFIFLALLSICSGQFEQCTVRVRCTEDDGSFSFQRLPVSDLPQNPTSTVVTPTPEIPDIANIPCDQIRQNWFSLGNGYEYWISGNNAFRRYSEAEGDCSSRGGRIVIDGVRNQATRDVIVRDVLTRCSNLHGWWIGYRNTGSSFQWNDGQGFPAGSSAQWNQGQPDGNARPNCAVIARYFNFNWDDAQCESNTMGVICERALR